jgi:hypothetical protein
MKPTIIVSSVKQCLFRAPRTRWLNLKWLAAPCASTLAALICWWSPQAQAACGQADVEFQNKSAILSRCGTAGFKTNDTYYSTDEILEWWHRTPTGLGEGVRFQSSQTTSSSGSFTSGCPGQCTADSSSSSWVDVPSGWSTDCYGTPVGEQCEWIQVELPCHCEIGQECPLCGPNQPPTTSSLGDCYCVWIQTRPFDCGGCTTTGSTTIESDTDDTYIQVREEDTVFGDPPAPVGHYLYRKEQRRSGAYPLTTFVSDALSAMNSAAWEPGGNSSCLTTAEERKCITASRVRYRFRVVAEVGVTNIIHYDVLTTDSVTGLKSVVPDQSVEVVGTGGTNFSDWFSAPMAVMDQCLTIEPQVTCVECKGPGGPCGSSCSYAAGAASGPGGTPGDGADSLGSAGFYLSLGAGTNDQGAGSLAWISTE